MTSISQLPPVETLAADDAIPVQQTIDGVTRYATPTQIQVAAGALIAASNLADVENEQAARNNLGLGTVAVLDIGSGLAAGGGNLAVEFGDETGTVADGGALAATTQAAATAQSTASTAASTASAASAAAEAAVITANTALSQILTNSAPGIAGMLGYGILNYAAARSATAYYMGGL